MGEGEGVGLVTLLALALLEVVVPGTTTADGLTFAK